MFSENHHVHMHGRLTSSRHFVVEIKGFGYLGAFFSRGSRLGYITGNNIVKYFEV